MKNRYGIHPKDFDLSRTEKYYSDMAAKGFALTHRGQVFSRFVKTQPQAMRYRVEVIAPQLLKNNKPPEEQLVVYADCGWEYVCGNGYIHIFCAPAESSAPEFYLDPAQQAETLQSLHTMHLRAAWLALIEIAVMGLLSTLIWNVASGHWTAQVFQSCVDHTYFMLGFFLGLILLVFDHVWAASSLHALYRQMKRGTPMNHAPRSAHNPLRVLQGCLVLAAVCCIIYDFPTDQAMPLPDAAPHEPYLLLAELDSTGERIPNPVTGKESDVTYSDSFLAESWHTKEFVPVTEFLYQDIYRLKRGIHTDQMVHALMLNSTFAQSPDRFTPIEIEGLDQAWVSDGIDCLAVKDDMVAYLCIQRHGPEELQIVLEHLAAKWNP